jgi:Ca2+-binding RTX toxin-like protein
MQQIDMDIVTSDLSGGNFRIVTDVSPDDEAPNFSPDGNTIAFARCVLDEDQQGFPICEDTADIFSVPTNGDENDVTQLTGGGQSDNEIDEDPAYSPDGTQMVFSRFTIPAVAESNEVDPRTVATGNELQLAASTGGASTDLTVGYNGDWQPIQPAGTPQTPGTPAASEDLGTCRGHDVTIAGTPASETIVGTPGDDVIKGRKGNDRIKGLGGDDYICGQRGRDKLFGNAGDDTLIGGQHRDFLKGGPGTDTLFGGTPGAPDDPRVPNTCATDPGDRTSNCKVG